MSRSACGTASRRSAAHSPNCAARGALACCSSRCSHSTRRPPPPPRSTCWHGNFAAGAGCPKCGRSTATTTTRASCGLSPRASARLGGRRAGPARPLLPRRTPALRRQWRSLPVPVPGDDPAPGRRTRHRRGARSQHLPVAVRARTLDPAQDRRCYAGTAPSRLKNVDVACPGFSADCIETLEEIEVENRGYFEESGGEKLRYIPASTTAPTTSTRSPTSS